MLRGHVLDVLLEEGMYLPVRHKWMIVLCTWDGLCWFVPRFQHHPVFVNFLSGYKVKTYVFNVISAPLKKVDRCENLPIYCTLKTSLCCKSFNCSSYPIACIFSMAGGIKIPFTFYPKVTFMMFNIGKALIIFVLWCCPITKVISLTKIW